MSEICLFVTSLLTPLYLEVISNIYIINGDYKLYLGELRPIGLLPLIFLLSERQ